MAALRKCFRIACASALASIAAPALAAPPVADPAIVPLFEETCLKGGLSAEARQAALAAGGWEAIPADTLKLKFLEPNPLNRDFAKPESVRQWKRSVGGREVRAVLATFRTKGVYPTVCALLVPDVKNSWPYWDALGAVLRPLGVKANDTDIPHYRAYGGKLADGRRARANISSKSAVVPDAKTMMHLFIAF